MLTTAKASMNGEPPDFGDCGCLFKALQTVYSQRGRVHRPGLPCAVALRGCREGRHQAGAHTLGMCLLVGPLGWVAPGGPWPLPGLTHSLGASPEVG